MVEDKHFDRPLSESLYVLRQLISISVNILRPYNKPVSSYHRGI